VIARIGNVTQAYLTGDMAVGRDSDRIDLVLVGDDINLENLNRLAGKAEKLIHREICCTIMSHKEVKERIDGRGDVWKIWGK